MIVLRNLMLAIAAFFVAGVGFYSYLLNALPPDQVQARASAPPSSSTSSTQTEASSSGWSLAFAVLGDFMAARREAPATPADHGAERPAVEVPEWLDQRFEQTAELNDKVITSEEKAQLLATLLELRALRQQHLDSTPSPAGDSEQSARQLPLGLTARAMQAELQFRQALGIGLAEFMKQMQPEDLARLLAIPAPAAETGAQHPVSQASAGVPPAR